MLYAYPKHVTHVLLFASVGTQDTQRLINQMVELMESEVLAVV